MPVAALGNEIRLATRNLQRHSRRSGVALAIISSGVIAYLLAGGFVEWIFMSMRESTIYSQLGHIQITRPNYLREGLSDPSRFLLPRDPGAVGATGAKGIKTLAPRLAFSGLISKGDATLSFIGEGIDPQLEAPISRDLWILSGKDLTESSPKSVLLGEGLAANLGAAPGDSIVLLVTSSGGGVNAVELNVAGIFQTSAKAYDDVFLRAPIDIASKLMRMDGATSWVVLLDRTSDTPAVVEQLRAAMPAREFEIIPWIDLADFYRKTVELFSRQVSVVRGLIALIVILSISNTMSMAVIERTGEIGTSMALGVRRLAILRLFICEGAMLGITGGMVGVSLGLLLGAVISAIGIPMPPAPGMAEAYTGEILITAPLALDAFGLALATTLLASMYPAWKASRMNIVDALRLQR